MAYIENCQIRYWYFNASLSNNQPYAIYNNCFLGTWDSAKSRTLTIESPTEIHNALFYILYYYSDPLKINTDNCTNSNIVVRSSSTTSSNDMRALSFIPYVYENVSYGPIDHKDYPAIPVVTSSEIDSKTDAVGNLHVKINAEVRD